MIHLRYICCFSVVKRFNIDNVLSASQSLVIWKHNFRWFTHTLVRESNAEHSEYVVVEYS